MFHKLSLSERTNGGIVAAHFQEYARPNDAAPRNADSLKKTFHKLSLAKRHTGDPTCSPHVRSVKKIARSILGRATSISIGVQSNDNDDVRRQSVTTYPS